jgi:hypothetical protein
MTRSAIITTPLTFQLIGRSAHATGQPKQIVLADTSRQRVGKLP